MAQCYSGLSRALEICSESRVIVWVKWNGGHLVGLNHSHNVQNNRGENGSQYTIGNETKASESSIFSPVFHGTRRTNGVRGGTHAQTLSDWTFDTANL